LDRQNKSQFKYGSAVIEKLVAIAQFVKARSFLVVTLGLTQSDIELLMNGLYPDLYKPGQPDQSCSEKRALR